MYQAYGLLTSASDFTLAEAATRLAARFPGFAVLQENEEIILSSGDWEIRLGLKSGPQVLEESRAIAEGIAGQEDGTEIASCGRRVEVFSYIPDPELEHFNDYLQVIEVLKSFPGLIAVDPQEPSLL
jgi:hypothetical protein